MIDAAIRAGAASLAGSPVMNTRDPRRARAHLSRLFRPHRVILHGHRKEPRLHFRHNRSELGLLSLNTLSYRAPVTIDARGDCGSYLVKFCLEGQAEVRQGNDGFGANAGAVCVLNPSRVLADRMSADYQMLILQVDAQNLRQVLAEDWEVACHGPLEFMPQAYPISPRNAGLARLVATVCQELERRTQRLPAPRSQWTPGARINQSAAHGV